MNYWYWHYYWYPGALKILKNHPPTSPDWNSSMWGYYTRKGKNCKTSKMVQLSHNRKSKITIGRYFFCWNMKLWHIMNSPEQIFFQNSKIDLFGHNKSESSNRPIVNATGVDNSGIGIDDLTMLKYQSSQSVITVT